MPMLYLMRHAKSSWDDAEIADHDRPLSPRGVDDAKKIGRYLKDQNVTPELVLCSTSQRTRATLEELRPFLPKHAPHHFAQALYLAPKGQILKLLADYARPEQRSILILGHSPGMEELSLYLARSEGANADERELRAKLEQKFPTAGLAMIAWDDADWPGWPHLQPGRGRLSGFIRPKDL